MSAEDGLTFYQSRVAEEMRRIDGLPESVIRAAVSWVNDGELCRRYGPALIAGYSIRAAMRAGVLVVAREFEQEGA